MELKPLETTVTKDAFVKRSVKVVKTPQVKVHKLSDYADRCVKILVFGESGSGKTMGLVGLLRAGLKILIISTDVGGDGLATVYAELKRSGEEKLLENAYVISGLITYDDVYSFLSDPKEVWPEIYDMDIDMVAWDGFSGFQLVQLQDHIGEDLAPEDSNTRKVSDVRKEGLKLEQQDWGAIKNATVKALTKFLNLNNPVTGKVWHKYMTCLEAEKERLLQVNDGDKPRYEEKKTLLIQGAAKKLVEAAFDIVIEARAVLERGDEGKKRVYQYHTQPHEKLTAKARGVQLEPIEKPDMAAIWQKTREQLGL